MTPRIEIEYCTQCRWLLRAAWMAQELLTTFEKEVGEVALIPGKDAVFVVRLDRKVIFSRKEQGAWNRSIWVEQALLLLRASQT